METPDILHCLNHYWGYPDLRPAQKPVIDEVMQGKSALVIMPTGGGKSMCYQLPAMLRPGLTLVISPLIALMKDQVDDLRLKGIEAAYLNSSQDTDEANRVFNALGDGTLKLLYIAPERLMSPKGGLLDQLQSIRIDMIAVDEAHCISSWGHDFRPAYTKLKDLSKHFPGVPVLALTATADEATKRDIIRQLELDSAALFENSFDRPEIHYAAQARTDEVAQLLAFVEQHASESGIVYCLSRKRTEVMADHLKAAGYKAECYHAGLSSEERMKRQEQFIRDEINIMVATIAFGMGIDKNNVRYVVHMNLPKNIEGYYQETGRAGRDGLESKALLLHGGGDFRTLSAHCEVEGNLDQSNVMLGKLRRMQDFADSRVCRRKILLQYFGEELKQDCGNCDNCETTFEQHDGTEDAQKLLSTVARLDWSYGLAHIVDILRGSKAQKITAEQQALSTHGIGADKSKQQWMIIGKELIQQGWLTQSVGQYPVIELNARSWEVLRGQAQVMLTTFREPPRASKAKKRSSAPAFEAGSDQQKQFDTLRAVRTQLAKAANVPAYVVLSDRSLKELCTARPTTLEDLASVHGFGKVKIEKFGQTFLDALHSAEA
ncbi:MAG: DNA helicase RecQ [Flavobacteriales bacterium]